VSDGEQVTDNPTGWIQSHIRNYVESGGKRGHRWSGMNTLLLTTRGRKTGLWRRTALIYGRDGDRLVVVGSNGGNVRHPQWFLNLLADPRVRVQVGPDEFDARASPAISDERPRLWTLMASIFPTYTRYAERTSREIPVVVIQPESRR
jgi:deazaflavin-dependent oxidoreductase (nitroreductase family)